MVTIPYYSASTCFFLFFCVLDAICCGFFLSFCVCVCFPFWRPDIAWFLVKRCEKDLISTFESLCIFHNTLRNKRYWKRKINENKNSHIKNQKSWLRYVSWVTGWSETLDAKQNTIRFWHSVVELLFDECNQSFGFIVILFPLKLSE